MLEAIQEQELSICVQRQCARLLAMLTEVPHIQVRPYTLPQLQHGLLSA